MWGSRVKVEHLIRTECTPSLIGGRGLLCRARSGRYGVTIIALYFPPKPKYSHEWTRYRRTVNELIAWLAPRLASLPQRTTPFVCADVNDGMGHIQINGQWVSDELMVVRPENATRGVFAGAELAKLFSLHGLQVANSYNGFSP
eukprot:7754488-Pyramimonas_sp.AAC.1